MLQQSIIERAFKPTWGGMGMGQTQTMKGSDSNASQSGDITVQIYPTYLADESQPDFSYFFWGYRVIIRNSGKSSVKLTKRFWRIIDCSGEVQEIDGTGVVGEQPIIEPGQSYEYSSGATLTKPSGIMEGHYVMVTPRGKTFKVPVPAFSLDSPHGDASRN